MDLPVINARVEIIGDPDAVIPGYVAGHGQVHRPAESFEEFFDMPARVEAMVIVATADTLIVCHPDNVRIVA